jgi:hypothetical protein
MHWVQPLIRVGRANRKPMIDSQFRADCSKLEGPITEGGGGGYGFIPFLETFQSADHARACGPASEPPPPTAALWSRADARGMGIGWGEGGPSFSAAIGGVSHEW